MEKMKIFVSWSGSRSAAVAQLLHEYLPMINNAFDPWLSSVDIDKGSRSASEIAQALVAAKAGIICLTPNNLTAPWILFEAGGIAKTVDKPLACTLLVGLEPSDVSKPLGEFQHTRLQEKDLLHLVKVLNRAAGDSARQDTEIEKAFKLCWPELRERLKNLPEDGSSERPQRSQTDMFAEILDTMRSNRSQAEDDTQSVQVQLDLLVADIAQIKAMMIPPPPPQRDPPQKLAPVEDLMTALKKSLAEMERNRPAHPTRGAQARNSARDQRMKTDKISKSGAGISGTDGE